jgi:hypothetical protein
MLVMKNPIDYLWYKIYKAFSYIEKGAPSSSAECMGSLFIINSLSILLIDKELIKNYAWIFCLLIIFIITPYFFTKKQIRIIKKYKNESEKSRIRGNVIVTFYIILSFVILFLIIKYRITIQNIL